jgi:two-component system CheB/CheR fusion protein
LAPAFCAEALANKAPQGNGLAEGLHELAHLINSAVQQARDISRGLDPTLGEARLTHALQALVTAAGRRMNASFECPKPVTIHKSDTVLHLFRIAHEAVANALKHSGASNLIVRLHEDKNGVRLEVEDDGGGTPNELLSRERLGIKLMRIRARSISAKLSFATAEVRGVCVQCVAPNDDNCAT